MLVKSIGFRKPVLNFYKFYVMASLNNTLPVKIGTHNGTFHCDEVLACYLLQNAKSEYKYAEIIRTRDKTLLDQCDVVVDVGGEYNPNSHRYDHHQKSFDHSMNSLNGLYPWTVKLSSAGLIYFHFGHDILKNLLGTRADDSEINTLYNKLYENFIQEIDAIDNGIEISDANLRYTISTNLSSRVKRLNPAWNDPSQSEEKHFNMALELVKKEFNDILNYYCDVWLAAKNNVKQAFNLRFEVHPLGEIIELKDGGCPWKEHLFEFENESDLDQPIKFVIYPDNNKIWRIQSVPIHPKSFTNRVSLPAEWCGLRDQELSVTAKIPHCIFVHMNGFIGGNKTREGVLKMATKALYGQ